MLPTNKSQAVTYQTGQTLTYIRNAKQILCMSGDANNDIGLLTNASILIFGEQIAFIGPTSEAEKQLQLLLSSHPEVQPSILDASEKIVLPGFIDCHTHVTFGGSRVRAYTVGLTDSRPEALLEQGIPSGIYASVNMTLALSKEEIKAQTKRRLQNMLRGGTTTVEAKSGYGLTPDAEYMLLSINRALQAELPMDIFSTFLGAHGWTQGMDKSRYIQQLCEEMIPHIAEAKLALYNDVWCDEGHFTAKESEQILTAGLVYGLRPRIHTDAYSYIGGSDLAASMHMLSADHLNYTPPHLYKRLANAGVTGVLLVGTDFAVQHPKPTNARPMLEAGMNLALATNCCPGCWCESMIFILTLACREHQFSPAEALRASTRGAAMAMELSDRGELAQGKLADLLILDTERYENIVYQYGANLIQTVIKRGKVVVQN